MNKNVITSLTSVVTPKGEAIAFKYSTLDDNGETINENISKTVVVMDDEVIDKIRDIRKFLVSKI